MTLVNDWVGVHQFHVIGEGTQYPVVRGNVVYGVELIHGANHNTLDTDVVSGNTYNGVVLSGSGVNYNTIKNSKIGTDATGTLSRSLPGASFGNGQAGGGGSGVVLNSGASHNTLTNDVISNSFSYGVFITDTHTNSNTLSTDKIGTNLSGNVAFPNQVGVRIDNQASFNTVGGSTTTARDLISGNNGDAVQISGSGTIANQVAHDYIGTNAAGTAALPNAASGVALYAGTTSNIISTNVLSGNKGDGVYATDYNTSSNTIQGNLIGTDATGTKAWATP